MRPILKKRTGWSHLISLQKNANEALNSKEWLIMEESLFAIHNIFVEIYGSWELPWQLPNPTDYSKWENEKSGANLADADL